MLKTDSITYSFTASYSKSTKKIGSVADFKHMNKPNYKDTRITLTVVVPVLFFCYFEYVLVCLDILRNNKLEEF